MKPYRNLSGRSGIIAYEVLKAAIKIKFTNGETYVYDFVKPGKTKVEKMKMLAKAGRGLSTYISRYIKDDYAEKL